MACSLNTNTKRSSKFFFSYNIQDRIYTRVQVHRCKDPSIKKAKQLRKKWSENKVHHHHRTEANQKCNNNNKHIHSHFLFSLKYYTQLLVVFHCVLHLLVLASDSKIYLNVTHDGENDKQHSENVLENEGRLIR